jgi:hypothetical protein
MKPDVMDSNRLLQLAAASGDHKTVRFLLEGEGASMINVKDELVLETNKTLCRYSF